MPKTRAWRLSSDSPFRLAAEGLHEADVVDIDGRPLVIAAPCSGGSGQRSLRAVSAMGFEKVLVSDTPKSDRDLDSIVLSGHYPNDLWVQRVLSPSSRPRSEFLHWDGSTWRLLEPQVTRGPMSEAAAVFDWFDGSKLVALLRSHPHSGFSGFYVYGRSAHAAPDFSQLAFPADTSSDFAVAQVDVAVLPTHATFVLHVADPSGGKESVVSLASSAVTGTPRIEELARGTGPLVARMASGTVTGRPVVVAWGGSSTAAHSSQFIYLADGTVTTKLPPLPPSVGELRQVWLAGGFVFAERGGTVWRLDGEAWRTVIARGGGLRAFPVESTGALWTVEGTQIRYVAPDGVETLVPFGDGRDLSTLAVVPIGKADVWLVATTNEGEGLLFRNRPVPEILACD